MHIDAASSVSLSGTKPEEVIQILERRRLNRSREDGNRVALVVEGGAMRGIYTAGSMLALDSMDLSTLFDNVYGTSAGAVNAAHFLSGVGHQKVDTYYRFLADGRFLNPHRWRKMVDIDFFVDVVLTALRPVEVDRVLASPTPLWIAVANFESAEPIVIDATHSEYPLLRILKAAVAMPILYNKTVNLGSMRAFDAGFCEPFPLDFALSHGHTHVLVLTARSVDDQSNQRSHFERMLFRVLFARGNRFLNQALASSESRSRYLRDLAHGRCQPPENQAIATIAPLLPCVPSNSQDAELMRKQTLRTATDTLRIFNADSTKLDQWKAEGVF